MKQTSRAGTKIYRGIEIPAGCQTFKIKSGQECYLSAIIYGYGIHEATIYVFELNKFIQRNYKEIEKYL